MSVPDPRALAWVFMPAPWLNRGMTRQCLTEEIVRRLTCHRLNQEQSNAQAGVAAHWLRSASGITFKEGRPEVPTNHWTVQGSVVSFVIGHPPDSAVARRLGLRRR